MTDEYYMELALEEAKIALEGGNWPIGCVIELDGEVIAKEHNRVHESKSRIEHAEKIAIEKTSQILWDNPGRATLYTTYEPCPMCFGAIMLSGIKKIVFGSNVDKSGASNIRKHLPSVYQEDYYKVDIVGDVLEKECTEVFLKGNKAFLLEKYKLYYVLEKNNIDRDILKENNVFLVGSSILRLFMNIPLDTDLDFYIEMEENYKRVDKYFNNNFHFNYNWTMEDGNFKSYKCNSNEVQLMNRLQSVDKFIDNFDFTIIKSYFSFKDEKFVFHKRFFDDIKCKKLVYESKDNPGPIGTMKRIDKYKKLGFKVDNKSFKKLYDDVKSAREGGYLDKLKGVVKKVSWLRAKEIYPNIPNIDFFVNWLMEIKEHKYFDKFNYYLFGGFISWPEKTKDIDILITKRDGQHTTLKELEKLMVDMFDFAYDIHGFFLDTCYMRIPQWIADYPRNKEILKSVEKKQLFITITKNKPEYMVKFKRYGKLNCCYMGTWEKFWKDKDIESEMIHRWVDLDANYTKMVDLRRIIKYYDNDKERNIEDFLNEFQEYSGY